MGTQCIPPLPPGGGTGRAGGPKPPPPPPPPNKDRSGRTEDSVELSPESLQKLASTVPDALLSAVSDLQGDQQDVAGDLKAIGDYFKSQPGGRRALDAFMEAHFDRNQLDRFRQQAPPPEGPFATSRE